MGVSETWFLVDFQKVQIFEGKWAIQYKIQFIVTDDVCFNIQKYNENVKNDTLTLSKKLIFQKQK